MRSHLHLSRSGGFAGIRKPPLEVDTRSLEPEAAERIQDLVDRSDFFALPADLGPASPGPDSFRYELQVTDGEGRDHRVSFGEPIASPQLRELVEAVRAASR